MASPRTRILDEHMFERRSPLDPTYRRSQAATRAPVQPTATARELARRLLATGDDARERRRVAQLLVDELSAAGGFSRCEVAVADRAQTHEHDGQRLLSKTYGYYRCWFEGDRVSRARIRIYNRTAVRQQVITSKVFLNTLLHEWVHHFDFDGLRLPRSPHTAGFFARLRALAEALEVAFVLPPERDADGNPILRYGVTG